MKAILEFDLDEPFERNAHERCCKATDVYLVIYDLLQMFRDEDFITLTREEIYQMLEERGINMDKLE